MSYPTARVPILHGANNVRFKTDARQPLATVFRGVPHAYSTCESEKSLPE